MPVEKVFVYGSLKRGFSNHHVMSGTKFVGEGRTGPGFALIDLGRYPGAIRGGSALAGEVFEVPSHLMGRLDQLEANGRVYERELTRIALTQGAVDAWIYLYLLAHGHEKPVKPRDGLLMWQESPALRA
jgi:gamma-glutamylaminecyclotransferase